MRYESPEEAAAMRLYNKRKYKKAGTYSSSDVDPVVMRTFVVQQLSGNTGFDLSPQHADYGSALGHLHECEKEMHGRGFTFRVIERTITERPV